MTSKLFVKRLDKGYQAIYISGLHPLGHEEWHNESDAELAAALKAEGVPETAVAKALRELRLNQQTEIEFQKHL